MTQGFGVLASDALRYWEPRRVLYNAALLAVVAIDFAAAWPGSKAAFTGDTLLVCFFLAVLANVAYCAAYAVDLFVQFSGLREAWTRFRGIVLLVGIAFAGVIAHFFAQSLLTT